MVTGQPLQTNWGICPSMSVKMRISLVCWIVSTETNLRVTATSPLLTFPWCSTRLHKNTRHQSNWSKVSLYLSPYFLSKNKLANKGPDSVAPVVIQALAPTHDKSLKSDRFLCLVRALRCYLDRTSDLRQKKELVFKKGFDKDISPATISSWIKQAVILCYEISDQEALN